MDNQSPFIDRASPALNADPTLSDESRASLWDAFHNKSAEELTQHLQSQDIPDSTKHALWTAKQASMPPVKAEPVDKVTNAINKMVALPDDVLDKAEQHPAVLKAFTTAATTPEKEPAGASGEGSGTGKGKKTPDAEEAPSVPTDVPATPAGHALVHSSNGGHYHVPVENLDKARQIDPSLTVLHVEP